MTPLWTIGHRPCWFGAHSVRRSGGRVSRLRSTCDAMESVLSFSSSSSSSFFLVLLLFRQSSTHCHDVRKYPAKWDKDTWRMKVNRKGSVTVTNYTWSISKSYLARWKSSRFRSNHEILSILWQHFHPSSPSPVWSPLFSMWYGDYHIMAA